MTANKSNNKAKQSWEPPLVFLPEGNSVASLCVAHLYCTFSTPQT